MLHLGFVKFLGQYAFDQGGLARKVGVKGLFAHPHVGGEIVHDDIFEAVSPELAPSDEWDALSDWIEIEGW